MLIHASCVAIGDHGILLAGRSGCGKSDLALRLIDDGAALVSDDQVDVRGEENALIASPPDTIAGCMEVRHVGLLRMPYRASAPLTLYVELAPPDAKIERMPEPSRIFLLDRPLRRLTLPAFAASTPAKIRAALTYPSITECA